VVTVKLGSYLGSWMELHDEQTDNWSGRHRLQSGRIGKKQTLARKIVHREAKGLPVEGKYLVIQCNLQQEASNLKSISGMRAKARQPEITPQASLQ